MDFAYSATYRSRIFSPRGLTSSWVRVDYAEVMAKSTNPIAVYTLRVDRAKLERIHEIAESEHRTLSQELRRMIDERIAQAGEPEPMAA